MPLASSFQVPGSDGSLGIRAIKAEGGLVLAQDEQSAKYNGMPKSAAATGAVDYVLPPEKIAAELVRISRHPVMTLLTAMKTGPQLQAGGDDLNKNSCGSGPQPALISPITNRQRSCAGFSGRMLLHRIKALEQYVRYLQENPAEVGSSTRTFLINVTSFFREPETFTALKNNVFPRMLENRPSDTPLRIWGPGLLDRRGGVLSRNVFMEFCEEQGVSPPIQFFASDIDEAAIEKARRGLYPEKQHAGRLS